MKRLVNGVEVELEDSDAEVLPLADRSAVRTPSGQHSAVAIRQGDAVWVSYRGQVYRIEKPSSNRARRAGGAETGEIFAPMPGLIVDVLVAPGETVAHRQKLVVLEAMKTQQAFLAPFDGAVSELQAEKGRQVQEGELLLRIEPATQTP